MADPHLYIEFSGGFAFNRLEQTIERLEPLFSMTEPAVVIVDLTRLVHFSPTSIALFVATLDATIEAGLLSEGSAVLPPNSPPVRRYLERMNVVRELTRQEAPEDFTRRAPVGFRPCEHFRDDSDYAAVARELTDALSERCLVTKEARSAIRVCLDEICENVIHHADTPRGGFAAAQGWPKKGRRQFEIGIADLGVGIRASLTKNPDYADIEDDHVAIATALLPRVTSTPARNAGIGLFVTSLLLAINGGVMLVRSGCGPAMRGATTSEEHRATYLPGTVVAVRANMDQPLDLKRVYAALEEAVEKVARGPQPRVQHADHPDDDAQAR